MLRSDLCDYCDSYNRTDKKQVFKNNAQFRSCISKINNTFIDNAKDFDVAMLMCNMLEYNDNYCIK